VVLLHGLWMRGLSMRWHAAKLAAAGFATECFDYASIFSEPASAAPRLAELLSRGETHVVAHSLGGLLVLDTLQQRPGLPVRRLVCLGTPLCGSGVARDIGLRPWAPLTLGRSAALLQRGCRVLPPGIEVGMVAGDRPMGLGQWLGRVEGRHDGTVAVAETRPEGLRDHVVVRASHSGLLFSREAARQVAHFLDQGRFLHPA
jgi:pimeloyl-ACP methyl ester carboxylesterase